MDDRMKKIEKKWNRLREGDADFTATDGLDDVDYLFQKVKELEQDLSLNASMLARQTDLAREAEIKVKELRSRVAELEEWCGAFKDI